MSEDTEVIVPVGPMFQGQGQRVHGSVKIRKRGGEAGSEKLRRFESSVEDVLVSKHKLAQGGGKVSISWVRGRCLRRHGVGHGLA